MKTTFKCTFEGCHREYVNSAILKRHVLAIHSQIKKFQCAMCGKSLASRQNLKEHSFIHSGNKPYSCKVPGCGMSFRQGTHLSSHKKTHQKTDFVLSFNALTRKLADLDLTSEYSELGVEIDLPRLDAEAKVQNLPSLFYE